MNVTKDNVDLVYNALLKHLDAVEFGVVDMRGCLCVRDSCYYTKLLLYSDRSPLDSIRSDELPNIMINEGIYCINTAFLYNIHMLKHAAEAKLAIAKTVLHYLKRDKVFIDALSKPFAPQKAKCYEQFAITYELTKSQVFDIIAFVN